MNQRSFVHTARLLSFVSSASMLFMLTASCESEDASTRPAPASKSLQSAVEPASPAARPAVPGLAVGDKAPDALLATIDGQPVSLASMYASGPVIVTFYRGGWCPFCNKALTNWQTRMGEVKAAGGTFVAITPEKPEYAARTAKKDGVSYAVLSDTTLQAAKGFNVHFVMDQKTVKTYKGYGLDFAETNAAGAWELPAPATFVIDRQGIVQYAFADWDYKERADPDAVIAALKQLTTK